MDLVGRKAQFRDYLDAVLRESNLERAVAAHWRKYFEALSIVRNKVSHFDVTLSDYEVSALREGGFSAAVTDGELRVNPRMYKRVIGDIRGFFISARSKLDSTP